MSLEPGDRFDSVSHLGAALLEFASPNARAMWTASFGGLTGDGKPRRVGMAGGISGGTMILPDYAAEFARASVTPPPSSGSASPPALSTFRHAPANPGGPAARCPTCAARGSLLGRAGRRRGGRGVWP